MITLPAPAPAPAPVPAPAGRRSIADDGYFATVTPAESVSGARTLLLSSAEDGVALAQPRVIAAGDVRGGRYVSGVVELDVTR